jgi:hypothetical protein
MTFAGEAENWPGISYIHREIKMFKIEKRRLPHEGIIPGARGHKKIVIPEGTEVYCIVHGSLFFWAAYLNEDTARTVARNLEETTKSAGRRYIPFKSLLAWNFKSSIPVRIHREKE